MKNLLTSLLTSALLATIAYSAPESAPAPKPATPTLKNTAGKPPAQDATGWFNKEIDSLHGADNLFFSGKVTIEKKPNEDQLFTLADIKGVIYGAKGSGTVIYAGSAWSVGESRDLQGHKVLFDELTRPSTGQPGKARFTAGAVSREVSIEDAEPNITTLFSANGWMIGDGSTIAVPAMGQKVGGRAWVTIDGRRHPSKVSQVEGSWTYLTVAREEILKVPTIVTPERDDEIVIVSANGKTFVTTYYALTSPSPTPALFEGAVVVTRAGELVGFIGAGEGFIPSTGGGPGKFDPAERRVQCAIEQ